MGLGNGADRDCPLGPAQPDPLPLDRQQPSRAREGATTAKGPVLCPCGLVSLRPPAAGGSIAVLMPPPPGSPQEFILSCLLLNPEQRPSAHNLLFHRVLFEVHSLKLLAAHCFINHQCEWGGWVERGGGGSACWHPACQGLPAQSPTPGFAADLMPENVVEEKTKSLDLNLVMAEMKRQGRPPVQWR